VLIPQHRYLVLSGSLPPGVPSDFYARVGCIANASGARTILDTSGEALRLGVHDGLYLLKCNLRELGELAGHALTDEAQQEAAAAQLLASGYSEVVVVSLGAAGALVVSKDGWERLRVPTVPVESKVGAGDSMVAGIVLRLSQGRPLREAILFGLAAGAAAVMRPGTQLCRREDTERLFERLTRERVPSS